MNQGVDRNDVFLGDTDRLTFERLLGQLTDEHGATIAAYCLMGNHYHLVARADDGGISAGMQQLSSSYTRTVNDRAERVGPLFRGRFTSVTIDCDAQLIATVAYVHRNPIDVVPMSALEAYRWSSYGAYLGRRPAPPWLDTSMVSSLLTVEEHRRHVADGLGPAQLTEPEVVLAAVAQVVPPDSRPGRIATLLAAAHAGYGTDDLVRCFGSPSPSAARMALSRARRTVEQSPELAAIVNAVESIVAEPVTHGV